MAYMAEGSPRSAIRMIERLETASLELAETAMHYPLLPNREAFGVRRRVVRPYNIFFSVDGDMVEVLHILHGSRNADRVLFPED
jgi:plasmid stabilization system protein ParE